MGQQYLIDSNAVIDYLSGKLHTDGMAFMNEIIDQIPVISVITQIEILGYKTTSEAYRLLTGFVEDSDILGLSDDVIQRTIEIRKDHKIKTPDAIIAATAVVNKLTIITRNIKDFGKIDGLKVINPYE
ncbi:MAG: hypothetical protein B6D61_01275 [Bacteroidetes bacterium 4484_249]|nr:MAG: hypothetical protein B6D61_01275 [Bacteroidetes bacterium 4484_249]